MKYFTSAENNPYFWWQLELLVESFKMQGIEDQLIIALADTEHSVALPPNMRDVKVFGHKNYGAETGYKPINKPMSVWYARQGGILGEDEPFLVLDPDMLLAKPLNEDKLDFSIPLSSQYQHIMEFDHMEEQGCPTLRNLEKMDKVDKWSCTGNTYLVGKGVPTEIFNRIADWCMKLVYEEKQEDKYWWCSEMVAWNLAFIEADLEIKTRHDLDVLAFYDLDNHHIIHYHNGVPGFLKHDYKDIPDGVLSFDPYMTMLTINPKQSSSIRYLQDVVRSYLEGTK